MSNIFVYGSLLADEVVEQLLQRVPKTQPGAPFDQQGSTELQGSVNLCNER